MKVEPSLGGVKILRVMKDEYGLRKNDFVDKIFHLGAGLPNWRFTTNA